MAAIPAGFKPAVGESASSCGHLAEEIIQGVTMEVKGKKLDMWVKPEDVNGPLLTEINRFFDPAHWHKTALNVYLFPCIGGTFQGVAQGGENRLIAGVWTGKPSHGEKPPVKTLLVEPEPMRVGSLGRTLSHELGHNLGLKHPGPDDPESNLLMGGRKQGYVMTPAHIATAKESAQKHLTSEPREFAPKRGSNKK